MRFDTESPGRRQKIINELPYTRIAQYGKQTGMRSWEIGGPVAAIVSDRPKERLLSASNKMKKGRGLLINWTNGAGARTIAGEDPETHLERVLTEMQEIWSESRDEVQQTLTNKRGKVCVEGTCAHYAPGQRSAYRR